MKLIIHPPVDAERLRLIRDRAKKLEVINAETPVEAETHMGDAAAFFGKITPDLLAAAANLKWVQSATASLEHYVFPELIAHPCQLTNMRGLYSDVIADHVFGYLICFARNFHRYIRQQAKSLWSPIGGETERPNFASGPGVVSSLDRAHHTLSDGTLGILGIGEIGSEVARRATVFGMDVVAIDPYKSVAPDSVRLLGGMDQLPAMLAESDYVVIAAPHTPETAGLFRLQQFAQMKPTAYLVNIGRGVIVNLDDLVKAIDQKMIAGAGLDVYEVEPLPSTHPLWTQDNVILTPHVAGQCSRIAERHLNVLLDNIGRFENNQPLRNLADKARWF